MLYSQELLEEIRMQNDIVDVISSYVPLKQQGSSYFGLCPFHNEKTPSFSVRGDKQFYYCFGCSAAGNVISFVMQMEGLNFVEAVKKLADRAHISLPEPAFDAAAKEKEKLRSRLFALHKETGRFYYECLQSEQGETARNYLSERGVSVAVQKKVGIGYAPADRGALYHFLQEKGYTKEEMIKSGLLLDGRNQSDCFSRFHHRVMFPIFDAMGRAVGFGGRILSAGEPKYLNSPETLIFNKSKNLYGLQLARKSGKDTFILVEGYMDTVSLQQAGFLNAVATLGTALNQEHCNVLKRFVHKVILLYDSDEAGTKAALRAIPTLVKNGLHVKVLQVPDGKDPDEFIRNNGSQAFFSLLEQAKSYITFQIDCARKKFRLEETDEKIAFTTEAARVISQVESAIEREAYSQEVAEYTGISEVAIKQEVSRMMSNRQKEFSQKYDDNIVHNYSGKAPASQQQSKGMLKAQYTLLYLWVNKKQVYELTKEILRPEDFDPGVLRLLAQKIQQCYTQDIPVVAADIINIFQLPEELQAAAQALAKPQEFLSAKDLEKAVNDGVKLIKKVRLQELSRKADSIEAVYTLTEMKRKVDELYIPIVDG